MCYFDQIHSFLGFLHRISGKIKNAFYGFEIFVLLPELFNFGKCVKYANERTHDVILSYKYNIKYINRPTSVNLWQRPFKHGRVVSLQATHLLL